MMDTEVEVWQQLWSKSIGINRKMRKSVRNIGILLWRISILIMTNTNDIVTILYVHVFKLNLLLNKNIRQNMNKST
jgi:hypothetical protein